MTFWRERKFRYSNEKWSNPVVAADGGVVYIVVIVSANITEDRGFESRQGVRFLGLYTLHCCNYQFSPHWYCVNLTEIYYKCILKCRQGVDVVNTIICDFRQFSAKKLAFFSKTNAIIIFCKKNIRSLSKKTSIFRQIFRRKYFLNHKIGPRTILSLEVHFTLYISSKLFAKNVSFFMHHTRVARFCYI
jgi:hypothetical protein